MHQRHTRSGRGCRGWCKDLWSGARTGGLGGILESEVTGELSAIWAIDFKRKDITGMRANTRERNVMIDISTIYQLDFEVITSTRTLAEQSENGL